MLHIEKGGAAQMPDELAAYNPLVPNGHELVATFMIEIDDPNRRRRVLGELGGIEETAFLRVGGDTIKAAGGDRPGPHHGRGQGVVGAVRAFPVHAGADRGVFPPGRAGGAGLHRIRNTATWPCCRKRCARNWPRISADEVPTSPPLAGGVGGGMRSSADHRTTATPPQPLPQGEGRSCLSAQAAWPKPAVRDELPAARHERSGERGPGVLAPRATPYAPPDRHNPERPDVPARDRRRHRRRRNRLHARHRPHRAVAATGSERCARSPMPG